MEGLVQSLSSLFMPSEILAHFEVKALKEEGGVILIDLHEKQDADHKPKQTVNEHKAVAADFMNKLELQTYPAQGKEVFLRLYRRKWKSKKKGEVGSQANYNTYEFTDKGMKATREFGAFLKEIGRE